MSGFIPIKPTFSLGRHANVECGNGVKVRFSVVCDDGAFSVVALDGFVLLLYYPHTLAYTRSELQRLRIILAANVHVTLLTFYKINSVAEGFYVIITIIFFLYFACAFSATPLTDTHSHTPRLHLRTTYMYIICNMQCAYILLPKRNLYFRVYTFGVDFISVNMGRILYMSGKLFGWLCC